MLGRAGGNCDPFAPAIEGFAEYGFVRMTRTGGFRLHEVDHDIDVATRRFRIGACLMGGIHQSLSDVAVDTRHSDVETSSEEVGSIG